MVPANLRRKAERVCYPKCTEGMGRGTEGQVKKTCGGERRLEKARFKWTIDHGICRGE